MVHTGATGKLNDYLWKRGKTWTQTPTEGRWSENARRRLTGIYESRKKAWDRSFPQGLQKESALQISWSQLSSCQKCEKISVFNYILKNFKYASFKYMTLALRNMAFEVSLKVSQMLRALILSLISTLVLHISSRWAMFPFPKHVIPRTPSHPVRYL